MKILLCIVLLGGLTLFAVWLGSRTPGVRRFTGPQPRTPRVLRQGSAPAGEQPARPPLPRRPKTATALSWMYSLPRDRRLVVFHDDTLDRMTPAKGFVHDMPWAEFLAQPLGRAATSTRLCLPICSRTVAEANPDTPPLIVETGEPQRVLLIPIWRSSAAQRLLS